MKIYHLVIVWTLLLLSNSVNANADILSGGVPVSAGDPVMMDRSAGGDMVGIASVTCGDGATSVEYAAGTSVQMIVKVGVTSCKATADIVAGETRIIGAYIPFDADMHYTVKVTYPVAIQTALYNTDCQSQAANVQIVGCTL